MDLVKAYLDGDQKVVRDVETWIAQSVRFRGFHFSREDLHDVTQETHLSLMRACRDEAFSLRTDFRSLVSAVAFRRCIDRVRRRRPVEGERDVADDAPLPDERMKAERHRELVRRAVGKLGPGCRRILYMFFFEDRPHAEIARILQRRAGTVRVRMHQCVERLRAILDATPREGSRG